MYGHHGLGFTPQRPDSGITILFYGDFKSTEDSITLHLASYDQTFTASELTKLCLSKKGIGTVAFPLYHLYDLEAQIWLTPKSKVTCSEGRGQVLVFRARCMPSAHSIVNYLFPTDPAFAQYNFLQMRHDFLNSRFHYGRDKSFGQEHVLGFVVMDLVRYGKEKKLELKVIESLDLKHFIPSNAKELFKLPWDRHRLRNNIKPYLKEQHEKFRDHSPLKLMLNFILGLCKYIDDYGAECFVLENGTKVFVDPYHPKHPGIYTMIVSNKDIVPFSRIEKLVSVTPMQRELNNKPVNSVILNRMDGSPVDHLFPSWAAALSFVALLNTYHRLLEDYHHQLCQEAGCPVLEQLARLGAHGPVSKKWAEHQLREKHRIDVAANYLVKQTSSALDTLVLVHLRDAQHVDFFLVEHSAGRYQLNVQGEPAFTSVEELLAHYKRSPAARIRLEKCVRPTAPLERRLYVCQEEAGGGGPDQAPRQKKVAVTLVSAQMLDRPLGAGRFTEVHLGRWRREAGDEVRVAVKRLRKEDEATDALHHLVRAAHKAALWAHATIVTVHSICLAPNFSVIMEHGEMGNLEEHLRSLKEQSRPTTNYVLVMVTEQLAQALLYLETHHKHSPYPGEAGCCHGNIRTRNVLVFGHEERLLRVKLGDPGMVYKYNKLGLEGSAERLPWLAPELYGGLDQMSVHSDRYAYGITVWEIMSNGERPFKYLSSSAEIQRYVRDNKTLQKPQNCPDQIYALMQRCWRLAPEERISAKEIVRDICNLIQSDYHSEPYAEPRWGVAEAAGQRRESVPTTRPPVTMDNGAFEPSSSAGSWAPGPDWGSATPLMGQRPGASMSSLGSEISQSTLTTDLAESSERLADHVRVRLKDDLPKTPDMPEPIKPLNREHLQWDSDRSKAIGSGHYGEVYRGYFTTNLGNPRPVAIKRLKPKMYNEFSVEFEKEFNIMIPLKHERIVEIIGHCPQKDENSPMLLVMEYVSRGALKSFLGANKKGLAVGALVRFSREIAEGMVYLSQRHIYHRDLAARNVLVTHDRHMKITDFGLAKAVEKDETYYQMSAQKDLPVLWYAPEALHKYKYNARSDVWSFGVTSWEIFSYGDNPDYRLKNPADLTRHLHAGHRLPRPPDCPPAVMEVINSCWEYEWKQRIDFPQIYERLARVSLE